MGVINSGGVASLSQANSTFVTTGTVETATATLANTEYSYAFPAYTKTFAWAIRNGGPVKVAVAAGDIGFGKYRTIYPGEVWERDSIGSAALTVYFSSAVAGSVVEIESWV